MTEDQTHPADADAVLRVFSDGLTVIDGVAFFDGIAFTGVGIDHHPDDSCHMHTFADGQRIGPFVEPLLDFNQDLVVYDFDGVMSNGQLIEEPDYSYTYKGQAFTGITVSRNPKEPNHLNRILPYKDGKYLEDELLEWHPGGALAAYRHTTKIKDDANLRESYRWDRERSPASSDVRVGLTAGSGSGMRVRFNPGGELVAVGLPQQITKLDDVQRYKHHAIGPVFCSLADLDQYAIGSEIQFTITAATEHLVLDAFVATGRLNNVRQITGDFSPVALEKILALPNLTTLTLWNSHRSDNELQAEQIAQLLTTNIAPKLTTINWSGVRHLDEQRAKEVIEALDRWASQQPDRQVTT